MSVACCAPLAPAMGWGARAGQQRLLRGSLVLTMAAALHLGAAAFFIQKGGGAPRSSGTVPAPIAMLWLVPAAPKAVPAVTPPPAVSVASRAVPAQPPPRATPIETPQRQATPEAPARTAASDEPGTPTAQPDEPRYAIARRSIVFGGAADTERAAPSTNRASARPLAGWLQDGVARSVWPVANALAGAGDGSCVATRADPQLVCATETLAAAAQALAPDARHSLLTWVQSGLVSAIEIRIESGAATYAMR